MSQEVPSHEESQSTEQRGDGGLHVILDHAKEEEVPSHVREWEAVANEIPQNAYYEFTAIKPTPFDKERRELFFALSKAEDAWSEKAAEVLNKYSVRRIGKFLGTEYSTDFFQPTIVATFELRFSEPSVSSDRLDVPLERLVKMTALAQEKPAVQVHTLGELWAGKPSNSLVVPVLYSVNEAYPVDKIGDIQQMLSLPQVTTGGFLIGLDFIKDEYRFAQERRKIDAVQGTNPFKYTKTQKIKGSSLLRIAPLTPGQAWKFYDTADLIDTNTADERGAASLATEIQE